MIDRPILFSGPMVRALLAGTKTQTRRVLRVPIENGKFGGVERDGSWLWTNSCFYAKSKPPYAVGDRLYVREAFCYGPVDDDPIYHRATDKVQSVVDGDGFAILNKDGSEKSPWRQAMHMPRWASRLTLTVTDVRVQRLQDISAEDARDEGVDRRSRKVRQMSLFGADKEERERIYLQACRWEYEELWDSLNADRGFGWDVNPWVVAVSFTVEHRNIDEAG